MPVSIYAVLNVTTSPDPNGIMAFAVQKLQAAEEAGQKAWIIGHMCQALIPSVTGWQMEAGGDMKIQKSNGNAGVTCCHALVTPSTVAATVQTTVAAAMLLGTWKVAQLGLWLCYRAAVSRYRACTVAATAKLRGRYNRVEIGKPSSSVRTLCAWEQDWATDEKSKQSVAVDGGSSIDAETSENELEKS
ncbi:hypothetical protein CPB85DRAFT_1255583 [Mucidula mucida]|nr:hypothetical protein CPB85DRAFT_1255583 [Mucidula mucida]